MSRHQMMMTTILITMIIIMKRSISLSNFHQQKQINMIIILHTVNLSRPSTGSRHLTVILLAFQASFLNIQKLDHQVKICIRHTSSFLGRESKRVHASMTCVPVCALLLWENFQVASLPAGLLLKTIQGMH